MQANTQTKRNKSDWDYFVRRGPVNFLSPRARQCRVNKLIISWVTLEEAKDLLQARNNPPEFWQTLTQKIEIRLQQQGTL